MMMMMMMMMMMILILILSCMLIMWTLWKVYHDFKYWEDRSDEFREGDGDVK